VSKSLYFSEQRKLEELFLSVVFLALSLGFTASVPEMLILFNIRGKRRREGDDENWLNSEFQKKMTQTMMIRIALILSIALVAQASVWDLHDVRPPQ
jgi:hypothetical protein